MNETVRASKHPPDADAPVSLAAVFDLTGRVALVTGAAGGLGSEFATTLAEAGAAVVCADIDGGAAEEVARYLRDTGATALGLQLDVTNEQQVDEVMIRADRELGGLDIVVNNAGIGDPRTVPLHKVRTEDWNRVMAINLDGVFYCTRRALKLMVPRRTGKIINVSSMYGLMGSRVGSIPAYAPSKAAVVNLTRELGLQYATQGIQVNALCPGYVSTGLSGGVLKDPEIVSALSRAVPMGRIAQTHELRGAILMLATSASDYMTGQALVIDGGCSAG